MSLAAWFLLFAVIIVVIALGWWLLSLRGADRTAGRAGAVTGTMVIVGIVVFVVVMSVFYWSATQVLE